MMNIAPAVAAMAHPQGARPLTPSDMRKPGRTLINRKRLLEMVPLSERTIFDMEKRGDFPRRFAISSRAVAWDLAEVEQWIQDRKSAATQLPAPGRPA